MNFRNRYLKVKTKLNDDVSGRKKETFGIRDKIQQKTSRVTKPAKYGVYHDRWRDWRGRKLHVVGAKTRQKVQTLVRQ